MPVSLLHDAMVIPCVVTIEYAVKAMRGNAVPASVCNRHCVAWYAVQGGVPVGGPCAGRAGQGGSREREGVAIIALLSLSVWRVVCPVLVW